MIEKCANPVCFARFHSLREGRVFVKEPEADFGADRTRRSRRKPAQIFVDQRLRYDAIATYSRIISENRNYAGAHRDREWSLHDYRQPMR